MWESQEIKEIGFPKGQSSVLVCKEDEVRVWSGGREFSVWSHPLLTHSLGKQMPIAAGSPRQALGDRGVSEEGSLVRGSPEEQ